jgi:hypothetical protein
LYSLYDALVSISVPSDKARAVVDAMERDMGTTLATKQDLALLTARVDLLATNQDLKLLAARVDLLASKQDVAVLRQEMESRFNLLAHEIATQGLRTTVRLGSMLLVGFGLTIAAMRLWM